MKTLIRCIETLLFAGLIAFLMMAGLKSSNAQPRGKRIQSEVLRDLPRRHATVRVKGNRFFFSNGKFFGKSGRGYLIVDAPVDAVVRRLPKGFVALRIGGRKYFRHHGVFYVKVKRGYKVVAPPWHFGAVWGGFGIGGPFFVPGLAYKYSMVQQKYRIAKHRSKKRMLKARRKNIKQNGREHNKPRSTVMATPGRGERGPTRSAISN